MNKRSDFKVVCGTPGSNGCLQCVFGNPHDVKVCTLADWECECLGPQDSSMHYERVCMSRNSVQYYIAKLEEAVAATPECSQKPEQTKEPLHIAKDSLPQRFQNKYVHPVWGYNPMERSYVLVLVDYYDVAEGFGIDDPAVDHATKKLVQPGARGHKNRLEDLIEARQSIERAIELEQLNQNIPWELV